MQSPFPRESYLNNKLYIEGQRDLKRDFFQHDTQGPQAFYLLEQKGGGGGHNIKVISPEAATVERAAQDLERSIELSDASPELQPHLLSTHGAGKSSKSRKRPAAKKKSKSTKSNQTKKKSASKSKQKASKKKASKKTSKKKPAKSKK